MACVMRQVMHRISSVLIVHEIFAGSHLFGAEQKVFARVFKTYTRSVHFSSDQIGHIGETTFFTTFLVCFFAQKSQMLFLIIFKDTHIDNLTFVKHKELPDREGFSKDHRGLCSLPFRSA